MTRPLVSVIIPTHNRPECAVSSIRAVLAASDSLEVVVSDSSPEDKISLAFAGDEHPRLKLFRPGRPMNVVENFNFALAQATGEFVVFIGDDDLVAPQITDVAQWAKLNSIDAVSFTFPVLYYWPSFESTTRWDAVGSTLVVSQFSGRAYPIDNHSALVHALRNLGAGVMDLPRAYAGMVSRSLVDRIISAHGALFGGVSPDIYSAALIAMECKSAYRVDYPIIVPGACGSSTSGQSARGKHVSGLRANAHIAAFRDLIWDDRIPEYYSVPTVWGFSILKAIEDNPHWLRRANFSHLYVKCAVKDPQYICFVLRSFSNHLQRSGALRTSFELLTALTGEASRVVRKLKAGLIGKYRPIKRRVIPDVLDTEQALQALLRDLSASEHMLELN